MSEFRMLVLKMDQTEEIITQDDYPELSQLQELVGGYIERVQLHLDDDTAKELECQDIFPEMMVNENGLAEELELNINGTKLYWQTATNNGHNTQNPIVGDAVVFQNFKLE
jgi:hypothetical protein